MTTPSRWMKGLSCISLFLRFGKWKVETVMLLALRILCSDAKYYKALALSMTSFLNCMEL